MDLLKIVFKTLKKNITLFTILMMLAIVGGVIHNYTQSLSYISNFKTNNGLVDYQLFKSLTDFNEISGTIYDLPEEEVDNCTDILADYKVSFVEETSSSISFTIVTKEESLDHQNVQNCVLKLINNNQFVKNSQQRELEILNKKLQFVKKKISQLDSILVSPSLNAHISEIPNDAYYLYTQQLELEDKISATGKFELIKPVTDIKTNKKPLLLFIALYIVLAGFLFVILAKKEKAIEL